MNTYYTVTKPLLSHTHLAQKRQSHIEINTVHITKRVQNQNTRRRPRLRRRRRQQQQPRHLQQQQQQRCPHQQQLKQQ